MGFIHVIVNGFTNFALLTCQYPESVIYQKSLVAINCHTVIVGEYDVISFYELII